MMRGNFSFGRYRTRWVLLLAIATAFANGTAEAGRKTRLFSFEDGTPGGTTTSAVNSITGPVLDVPDDVFGEPSRYYDAGPGGIAGGTLLGDWVSGTYDPSPDLDAIFGMGTFVNVANGSPLDSPAANSNVGMRFDGSTALEGPGFRGTFILNSAVDGNLPSDSNNTATSFTALSQAWVRPDIEANGTSQVVWAVGEENGGVRITPDGFWELTSLGPPGSSTSPIPVAFNEWTHIGVLRTGGFAQLYVNGSLATNANGFFNKFGDFVTLGAAEDGLEPFVGVVDNFSTVGTAGFGIDVTTDLDVFSDLGLPTPTGVAGDVDQDGDADQDDYLIWSSNSGVNNGFGFGDLTTLIKGDVDQNGRVDFFDFQIIAREASASVAALDLSSKSVPEPGTGTLLVLGVVAAFVRHRRWKSIG